MSFPARKGQLVCVLVLLLVISVLQKWDSGGRITAVAIRVSPTSSAAAVEQLHADIEAPTPPRPGKINQTQIFGDYFNGIERELNRTRNGTFLDSKRRIPSCPDPLHN